MKSLDWSGIPLTAGSEQFGIADAQNERTEKKNAAENHRRRHTPLFLLSLFGSRIPAAAAPGGLRSH
jgi:hypothetical protein